MRVDLQLLQGRWRQVHYERDGVTSPSDLEQGWQPITLIRENTFSVVISDGSLVLQGKFELFETETPKGIDWFDESGPYASDYRICAIYEVSDSSFIFCAAYEGNARPREFRTEPGLVLRRMERMG